MNPAKRGEIYMDNKEYKISHDSFIGSWFIPTKICDDLVTFFKKNKKLTVDGVNSYYGKNIINKEIKESKDLIIGANYFEYPFDEYRKNLQNCLYNYIMKYPEVNEYDRFNVNDDYIIQYYPPKGGYKKWHFESTNKNLSKRILVFMTYLNDVEDAGTEFKYQKLKTECKKGLTLIWPSAFTHTHKGIVNKKNEKYIITGWFTYN